MRKKKEKWWEWLKKHPRKAMYVKDDIGCIQGIPKGIRLDDLIRALIEFGALLRDNPIVEIIVNHTPKYECEDLFRFKLDEAWAFKADDEGGPEYARPNTVILEGRISRSEEKWLDSLMDAKDAQDAKNKKKKVNA